MKHLTIPVLLERSTESWSGLAICGFDANFQRATAQ
jgi:hypothetical protein